MPSTRQSNRKRKRDPSETAAAQLRQCLAENARLRKDPYGIETAMGSVFKRPHCSRSSHARKKNCANDIFCLYGLGEGKEGVWHRNPPQIQALGPDPRLGLRIVDPRNAVVELRSFLSALDDTPMILAPNSAKQIVVSPPQTPQLRSLRPAGLTNLGATCYVSSLLQGLFHNPVFRRAVYSYPVQEFTDVEMAKDDEYIREERIMVALQNLFCALDVSVNSACDPTQLVELLGIKHSEQQDAQEFNILFLAKLERVFKRRSIEALSHLFSGRQAYVTECQSCRKLSCREETMDKIEINVQGCSSVADAIDAYCATELLHGDNQYFCEGCKAKRDASRSIQLRQLPRVLNVQLLRYVYDRKTFTRKKLKDRIQLDETIQLNGSTKRVPQLVDYRLVAVLYHRGASAYGGHYVAEVRDWASSKWWVFDDESVTPLEGGQKDAAKDDAPPGCHKCSSDAYMLIYAQSAYLAEVHEAGHAPMSALRTVLEEDIRELDLCEAYARRLEDVTHAVQQRKDLYETIFSNGAVPPTPQSPQEDFHFVRTAWLKNFVTGTPAEDSKEPAPTVFSGRISNASVLCPHQMHLHPMKTPEMKVVSAAAFDAIVKVVGPPDFDLCNATYRCRECIQGLERENSDEEKGQRRLIRVLGLLEQLETSRKEESPGGFFLSRAWAAKFKQSMDSLLRQVAKQNGTLSKAGSAENGKQSTLTDIWTNPSSRIEEKLDVKVNSAISCEHGNLTTSRSRYIRVSGELWTEIKAAFPEAMEFPSCTAECSICSEKESRHTLDKQSGREARVAELSSHRDVKQLRQRKQQLPSIFVQLEDHSPSEVDGINDGEVFYLVERKWVHLWRTYHASQTEPRPRNILNEKLLCEHGKVVLSQAMLDLFTKPQRGVHLESIELRSDTSGIASAVEDVEIVTSACWRELRRMYGTSSEDDASSKAFRDVVEVIDEDVIEICDLEQQGHQSAAAQISLSWAVDHWDFKPELCFACMDKARQRQAEERSNFIDQHVRIIQLKDGEDAPSGDTAEATRSSAETQPCNGNDAAVDSLQSLGKPRRNKPRRRRRWQSKPMLILASHTDTLMQLKLKIWEEISDDNASPNRQELNFGGKVLLDNEVTLRQAGIKANDTLYLRIQEGTEENDCMWFTVLAEEESGEVSTEVGFKGTFLHS